MAEPVLLNTKLAGLRHVSSGKVRDMFDLGESLLIVTTDRLSAFDVVMANGIPYKGKVLNRISEFWFNFLGVPHHMITCDIDEMPAAVRKHAKLLRDRAMLVKKANPFPVECVARGYLIGSGWKDYQAAGSVCGIKLPPGLQQASKLERPIFTPATKAKTGHDENIGFDVVAATLGKETAVRLHDLTLAIYGKASAYAESKGVILADTKFEFGMVDDRVTLIDEVLTPDSSRYWPRSGYRVGISPPSFDKQFVRDYLEEIRFNKKPPGPVLPDEIVRKTSEKYLEAFRILTGRDLGA
ncbi:MAG TPA: phosphoribosylaminoimidazolesuccinocarboxamide synthase [Planctomycetota bacterium]|jgi:phosphoribosylaminoimidazole-succinocarboxamide synthase|nr:phosphoribosylaminoimidazolesuccinocarboxamide synthase [Planctomycetota bacterium]